MIPHKYEIGVSYRHYPHLSYKIDFTANLHHCHHSSMKKISFFNQNSTIVENMGHNKPTVHQQKLVYIPIKRQEAWRPNKLRCNLNSMPRCKTKMLRNQWTIFEKMTEDLNYDLFWGPKWLGNRASETNVQHNWHVNHDWCETSGNVLRNYQRQEFDLFWGPTCPTIWDSEAHILRTSKSTCNEYAK